MASTDLAPLLDFHDQNKLCSELAANLGPAEDVLERYNLSRDDFLQLAKSPAFQHKLREARAAWMSKDNIDKRIKAKAQTFVEDALPYVFDIIKDGSVPASQRVDAVARIARIAGVDQPNENVAAAGAGFQITINLGGDSVSVSHNPQPQVIEHEYPNEAPDEHDNVRQRGDASQRSEHDDFEPVYVP